MSEIDLTFLSSLPIEQDAIFRALENTAESLKECLSKMSLAEARTANAAERLAPLLVGFCDALWAALAVGRDWGGGAAALGREDRDLVNAVFSLYENLPHRPQAHAAQQLLRLGVRDVPQEGEYEMRVEAAKRDLQQTDRFYGADEPKWRQLRNTLAIYTDALLDALKPAELGCEIPRRNGPEARRAHVEERRKLIDQMVEAGETDFTKIYAELKKEHLELLYRNKRGDGLVKCRSVEIDYHAHRPTQRRNAEM